MSAVEGIRFQILNAVCLECYNEQDDTLNQYAWKMRGCYQRLHQDCRQTKIPVHVNCQKRGKLVTMTLFV